MVVFKTLNSSSVDIVALGEPMVEFNQTGERDGRVFLQGFGGDTSNFAVSAARQGARVAYLSALGDDPYGHMLQSMWRSEGIDISGVQINPTAFTAIYFVTHDKQGHHFNFFRKGSAASLLRKEDLSIGLIQKAKVLHFSGISLAISEIAQDTCWHAVKVAREHGVKVSFDTNLRLKLWSVETARTVINRAISLCDLCLPSFDDMTVLTGLQDPRLILKYCHELGAKVVALKLGDKGAMISDGKNQWHISPVSCKPVDATGAGDTFGGALVHRWCEGDDWLKAGNYAAKAAAMSTEGYGAVEPIPFINQVMQR